MFAREPSADERLMERALVLAERGRGRVEPNPLVGALVVRHGEVVGEGWHREYGGPHAEVDALSNAGPAAKGSTVYVTLEPCSHHGKTPPCAEALIHAGVARVVYAVSDPDPVARGGAKALAASGIHVDAGICEQPARDLNARFFHRHSADADRPWTELKLAVSLDSRIADSDGRSRWLTGEEARAEVHRLRAGHDAIAIGIGTALADDPSLTVRGDILSRRPPVRVVFDRALRLPATSTLARTAREAPVWVVGSPNAPAERRTALAGAGVTVLDAVDLLEVFRVLQAKGISSILCEGGGKLAASLLDANLVDRISLFVAPILLGSKATPAFCELRAAPIDSAHRWRRTRTQTFGNDTLLVLDR